MQCFWGNTNDIEIMDEKGNKDFYPQEFLEKSEYFKGVIETNFQPPLLIPTNISLSEMHNLYMDSLTDFSTSSLKQLFEYVTNANKILNHSLQEQLIKLLFKRLASNNPSPSDKQEAYAVLSHLFGIQKNDVDTKVTLLATDKKNKTLNITTFNEYFKSESIQDDLVPSNISYIAAMIYNKNHNESFETTQYIAVFSDTIRNMLRISFWNIDDPENLLQLNTQQFVTYFKIPLKKFNWKTINTIAFNNYGKIAAFANASFIIICPIPSNVTNNLLARMRQAIMSSYSGSSMPTGKLLSLDNSDYPCTHVAFSTDNNYLTYIKNGKCFIVSIEDGEIKPIDLPAKIFSSVLIDDTLLIRTLHGNTYAYNIKTHKISHIPNVNIDYFSYAFLKTNGDVEIHGFYENSATNQIRPTIEKINIKNKGIL